MTTLAPETRLNRPSKSLSVETMMKLRAEAYSRIWRSPAPASPFRRALSEYAAALDQRVKAIVSISGFTPMRTDTADRGTGGIARYFEERGLIPRLGFFLGHEDRIPYDFDGLIAAIAPRPVLVVEPTMDRISPPADVRAAVEQARRVYALYNAGDKLALVEPKDYTRLPTPTQNWAVDWLNSTQNPVPVQPGP